MRLKNVLAFTLILLAFCVNAQQKEGNIWYFGRYAGIDFNGSTPTLLTNGAINTIEGCAVICNKYGNLMFYTDGSNVYNRNHTLMPNGNGLKGNPSSTQSGIIVPNPANPKVYYVFSASGQDNLYYSVIDTSLSGGQGNVTTKNVALMPTGTEKLNAVKHKNRKDTWVVSHQSNNNSFYAYLVTASGVSNTPVISKVGSTFSNISAGWLKFSPKGDKIVTADFHGIVELFDFNPATGVISNAQTLINASRYYGVEFSPSGRFLYVSRAFSTPNEVIQFDMSSGNITTIQSSKVVIANSFIKTPGALQLAPNGKIYMAFYNFGTHLGVINRPEKKGKTCFFVEHGFALSPKSSSWGLPSFNQSFFYRPNADIEYEEPECDDLTVKIFNVGDTQSIIKSYWDFGDGTKDSGKRLTKTYNKHGSYTLTNIVHIQAEDSLIIDSLTKIIKTKQPPVAYFGTSNYSQCFNENYFEFKDSSKYYLGASYKSNSWILGENSPKFANIKSIARKFNDPNVYDIELIVESSEGCKDTLVRQIVVQLSPTAKFDIQDSIQCYAGNKFITLQQSYIDSTETLSSYNWTFGDNSTDTKVQPQKSYTDTGSYIITMEVVAANNCRDTTYDTISVLPNPQADFTAPSVCHKDTTVFNNLSTTKTTSPLQYLWILEKNIATDTTNNPVYYYQDSGQYTVKLKATNTYNCKDSIYKTITIYPKPQAAFETTGNCTNTSITLTDKTQRFGTKAAKNTWNLDNGKSSNNPTIVTTTYTTYGNKNIQLRVEDQNGCIDSINKQLFINALPTVNFTINQAEQCIKGNNFQFSNTTTIASGGNPQYKWDINGAQASQNINLANQTLSSTGVYNIKLLATSDSGCVDSIQKNIEVYPNIKIDVSINKTAQCFNQQAFLISNKSTVSGSGSITKYRWRYSDNTEETTSTPKVKKFTQDGAYTLEAILETDKGCLDSFSKTLTVWYSPIPSFDTEDICLGDSAYFDNTTSQKDSINNWYWNFGDGISAITENSYRKYLATGNYEITLVATTNKGCKDTIKNYYPNLVKPQPSAYFEDTLIDSYDRYTTIQFNNKSTGATDYLWDFGDGTIETIQHPTKLYNEIGQLPVTLTVNNQWDCEDNYQKKIFVVPTSYINIPNAFSPGNADTLNAYFKVEGIYFTKEIEMQIFNKWGQLIFRSNQLAPRWDGRYKGELVQDGVYPYAIRILDYKNKLHIYNGSVTVIK